MQDGIVASKNTTASNGNEKSPKKVALGIGIGCLAVALIIGAFFIGKSMAKNDNSDNDNVANEDIASELAFVQADLASTKQKLQEAERALAETTGQQSAVPEKSLQEQLQFVLNETGIVGYTIRRVDEILNSPIIPFQTVAVNIANDSYAGGSVAQFWRNGTNGTWHFFMTGQNTPDCSFFRDFSLPFAGYLCYDGVSNTQTTVGKHFNVL